MKKIKYQGGITKFVTCTAGNINKQKFKSHIATSLGLSALNKAVNNGQYIDMSVVSFSSANDFTEQVFSILSFLKYVSKPAEWVIYSDGSHTNDQIALLAEIFDFVKFKIYDWADSNAVFQNIKPALAPYKDQFLDYGQKFPLGKRLYYYLNHNIEKPTLFLDSDVLFYNKAAALCNLLNEPYSGWFLPDAVWGCLDNSYKNKFVPQAYQVNGGFFILKKELENISGGLDFLKSLNCRYEYFTEQTVMHILLKDNGLMPLDPRIFILNSADQFDFAYLYPRESMAIRHYTGPVRHKMWQKNWKWHLALD